ncbi:phage Tail Protein X family protein [Rhodococcus sp. MTM3W5.2]|uniref:LysM peptidoglycan-binding domain-containing protein n=1 Tax=Rhodococcus sp. MTM3W5.2 TaxID=1805827 RepID=UPI0009797B98|nr:LysM peptidoglycan-binding domain-containing protein [Rhodococcus sp. MTM3W5.2]AQA21068.1 phage Tail Protein X family protein [Rhodococcus sp. MTM3W5.2]
MIKTHTVVAGDTLSAIAKRFYGQAALFDLIAAASGVRDPDLIQIGMVLIIPEVSRKHTVVDGETLSGLAGHFYHPQNSHLFPLIAAANGISDPDEIQTGQVLIIPGIVYKVVSGDTLSKLAKRFYGDETLFPLIADANEIANPDVIRVGQELIIPRRARR